ncbi:MAG: AAA family ATPase [Puniceicoccales bacterium]|jgi:RecA-family ATPase|nr:AAA family ATPase [Puniceicoccales bacterium]
MTDLNKNWAPQMTEAQQVKNSTALSKMKFDNPCKENLENNSERLKHWEKHSLYHLVEEREQFQEKQRLLLGTMNNTVMDAPQFFTKTIVPRKVILDPWFREGGLGYIFGRRGTRKSWLAWYMALSISAGRQFGKWQCPTPQKVLYVDSEMSMDAMQRRLILLDPCPSNNLYISSHQALAEEGGIFYNLANSYQQEDFLEYCVQNDLDVVFLDNLSCLFSGMKENEADSWEQVRKWLLKFRQPGIAVVIVHHSNRTDNDMRGTSHREDAADWITSFSKP